jgi:hypothetical protein
MVTNILSPTQAALSAGWGTLGSTLGTTYEWYQNQSTNNPISTANDGGSFFAYFDRDSTFPATKAAEYGKPEYFVAYDRGGPNVGDYLVGATDTYFIINQDDLTPSKVVKTNATVDFYRPGAVAPTDPVNYSKFREESAAGFGNLIATGWPISLLSGSRGEKATLAGTLPDASRQPWWNWLCPAIPGVRLRTDDKFMDENGTRYQISGCESTDLGYRGTAQLEQA